MVFKPVLQNSEHSPELDLSEHKLELQDKLEMTNEWPTVKCEPVISVVRSKIGAR